MAIPNQTRMTRPMSFLQHFAELPDPRSHINRSYDLLDIVFLTVCAVLSGAEGWKDIEKFGHTKLAWLRKFRDFKAMHSRRTSPTLKAPLPRRMRQSSSR